MATAADEKSNAPCDGEDQREGRRCDLGAAVVSGAFGLLACGMAFATVLVEWWRRNGDLTDQASAGSLAGLLLLGVLTFFFALGSLIALFRALGLTSGDHALGMPQGSIRAFMALVLIMLFFLMAVFLYLDVARTGTERRIVGIGPERYDQIVATGEVISADAYTVPDPDNPEQQVQRWDVVVGTTRERSQVAEELARQLVTVLGTLIVAIAAFYFGANSVQQKWRDTETLAKELGATEAAVDRTSAHPVGSVKGPAPEPATGS